MTLDNTINTEVLENIIEKLKSDAVLYENGIALNVIEKCSFILEVGALTIGTDDTGKVITQNTGTPTQFSQEAVDEIFKLCFKKGNGETILPKVYSRNEWYRSRLKMVNESLKLLEQVKS